MRLFGREILSVWPDQKLEQVNALSVVIKWISRGDWILLIQHGASLS